MRFRSGLSILERILKRFPGFANDDVQLWATLRNWFRLVGQHAFAKWRANRRLWRLPFLALETLWQWLRKDYEKKVLPRLAVEARSKLEIEAHAERAFAARLETEAMKAQEQERADAFDREVWCPRRPPEEEQRVKEATARLEKPKPIVDVVTVLPSGPIGLEAQRPRETPIHPSKREQVRESRWAEVWARLRGADPAKLEEVERLAQETTAKNQRQALRASR